MAQTITMVCPILEGENSGPAVVCIFSQHGAHKYALQISTESISSSFMAAIQNVILTLSLVTAEE
jgi:hypothetical protein